jgi:hypothetical protein
MHIGLNKSYIEAYISDPIGLVSKVSLTATITVAYRRIFLVGNRQPNAPCGTPHLARRLGYRSTARTQKHPFFTAN